MNLPGFTVMLKMLSGNEKTATCLQKAIGKEIKRVFLDEENNSLRFVFTDGSRIRVWDDGQSCCECRYMQTDDDLTAFSGASLLGMELKDAPFPEKKDDDCDDVHEVQFLDVKTSLGVFTMASHNEHSGYYGGFAIEVEEDTEAEKETGT